MYRKLLVLAVALIAPAAQADWDNPTLTAIQDGATYFSLSDPCALQISKSSQSAQLHVTYAQNPVFWFPGLDSYRDTVGAWREANRCPKRNETREFYCAPHMKFCSSSLGGKEQQTLEITDAGDLLESSLDSDLRKHPRSVLSLYTNDVALRYACEAAKRASSAADSLQATLTDLQAGRICQWQIKDQDTGVDLTFYTARCVSRETMKVYVSNSQDRIFVNHLIALTALAFEGVNQEGTRGKCLVDREHDYGARNIEIPLVDRKCSETELSIAIDSLRTIAQDAGPSGSCP